MISVIVYFLAMVEVGIGESQINMLLAILNLPTISHKTLKRREREIASSIRQVAEESCDAAIQDEIKALDEINEWVLQNIA